MGDGDTGAKGRVWNRKGAAKKQILAPTQKKKIAKKTVELSYHHNGNGEDGALILGDNFLET